MSTFNRIIFLLSTKQISGCLNNVPVSFPGIMGSSVNLFLNNLLNYKKVNPMQLVYYPMLRLNISSGSLWISLKPLYRECFTFLVTRWQNISAFQMATFSTRHQKASKWEMLLGYMYRRAPLLFCFLPHFTRNLEAKLIISLGRILLLRDCL